MAKGYHASGDILTRTRDGQDLNAIWNQYQQALAEFNAQRQPLIDLLSFTTPTVIEDIVQPGTEDFERASEYGIPSAIKPMPAPTARAYPFEWYDTRAAYTFQFLAGGPSQTQGASQRQLDAVLNNVLEADNRLQFMSVMRALFNNLNRTTIVDGIQYTVPALYNADTSYIPTYNGNSFDGATHTHYTATGSTQAWIFDPNDVLAVARLVEEHGYNRAAGYNIMILMNKNDADASVVRYTRGVAYDASTVVSLYDFIPTTGQNFTFQLPPGYTLQGSLPPNTWASMDVIGSWGPYMFIGNNQIPAGYMVAVATRGNGVTTNVVGIREHANPGLRGVVLRPGNNQNYPLIDSFYIRGLGSGIGPRGAAAIMFNGASYAVPAAYAWA